ncbi:hypothetical protein K2X33_07730 [bacterium]|nr:hypothetical protein [bacterium]
MKSLLAVLGIFQASLAQADSARIKYVCAVESGSLALRTVSVSSGGSPQYGYAKGGFSESPLERCLSSAKIANRSLGESVSQHEIKYVCTVESGSLALRVLVASGGKSHTRYTSGSFTDFEHCVGWATVANNSLNGR